jgi:predicted transposase/invertase (TIGR01784 family)
MDFVFDETPDHKFFHDIQLIEVETQQVFNDKLSFIYLEMPKFDKTEEELKTHFDKWMFLLKNLPRLQKVSPKLQERIFMKVLDVATVAKFNPEEKRKYQDSLKHYRDLKNVTDTAIEEGKEVGREEKAVEIALKMKKSGFDAETISGFTELSIEEIENL